MIGRWVGWKGDEGMGGGGSGARVVRSVGGVRGEWRRGGKRGSFVCVSLGQLFSLRNEGRGGEGKGINVCGSAALGANIYFTKIKYFTPEASSSLKSKSYFSDILEAERPGLPRSKIEHWKS
jgi:hypothetical protein